MSDPQPRQTKSTQGAFNDSARRLQFGIAGVLAVLLLVGLAGLIGDRAREQAAAGPEAVTPPVETTNAAPGASEPLVDLGVQPTAKADGDSSKPAGAAVAPAPKVPDLEPDPALERARRSEK